MTCTSPNEDELTASICCVTKWTQ